MLKEDALLGNVLLANNFLRYTQSTGETGEPWGRPELFMQDRSIVMSVDGQDGPAQEVTTGLPQGPPVSPVLFNLYIGEIHGAVEGRVPGARGIPYGTSNMYNSYL